MRYAIVIEKAESTFSATAMFLLSLADRYRMGTLENVLQGQ